MSDIDVELYYQYHPDQFRRPETRRVRHILVTINDDLPDNTRRGGAQAASTPSPRGWHRNRKRFEEQAHEAFGMPHRPAGRPSRRCAARPALSRTGRRAVRHERRAKSAACSNRRLGFHLLRCDAITPAAVLTLNEARGPIRTMLEQRRKRVCQGAWVKQLLNGA